MVGLGVGAVGLEACKSWLTPGRQPGRQAGSQAGRLAGRKAATPAGRREGHTGAGAVHLADVVEELSLGAAALIAHVLRCGLRGGAADQQGVMVGITHTRGLHACCDPVASPLKKSFSMQQALCWCVT